MPNAQVITEGFSSSCLRFRIQSFHILLTRQSCNRTSYLSCHVKQRLCPLHTLADGFVDVHSRCFLSLVNPSSSVFY